MSREITKNFLSKHEGQWQWKNKEGKTETNYSIVRGEIHIRKKSRVTLTFLA